MECIKIVISTKQLANDLKPFDFSVDIIRTIICKKDSIILVSDDRRIDIDCATDWFGSTIEIDQQDRRWDWLSKLMKRVHEQPVELWISEDWIKVLFHY